MFNFVLVRLAPFEGWVGNNIFEGVNLTLSTKLKLRKLQNTICNILKYNLL